MYHGQGAANAKKGYERYMSEHCRSTNKARHIEKQLKFTFKQQAKRAVRLAAARQEEV